MSLPQGLVGDIGGTHARFALASGAAGVAAIHDPKTYDNRDFATAYAAMEAYLRDVAGGRRPASAVLAVAGPVTDGTIRFTNSKWEISEERLRTDSGFATARLINDFAAQALGAPRLEAGGLRRIGPPVDGQTGATIAVLGPGTGFGVGALARDGGQEAVLATEGGHAGFAPADEVDIGIWRWLRKRHGHVSVERVLSGPGLHELYLAMAEIAGAKPVCGDERQVQAAGEAGDALAGDTVARFCRILGSAAGDIALGLGARGGVYVTGGVAVGLADRIATGPFRDGFEAKGRFQDYMRAIPTFVIVEPYTALIGAASLVGAPSPE